MRTASQAFRRDRSHVSAPDKAYFVILRLYGPKKAFYDKTWRPSDIEPVQ